MFFINFNFLQDFVNISIKVSFTVGTNSKRLRSNTVLIYYSLIDILAIVRHNPYVISSIITPAQGFKKIP